MSGAKKRIVFLGNLPLATRVLRRLDEDPRVEIVGVVCEPTPGKYLDAFNEPSVIEEVKARKLPTIELKDVVEEFPPQTLDFAISCRAPYLLRRDFLEHFKKGVINFHGGPLPELRGVDAANHAILLGFKQSGGTIHYMAPGIDEGPILSRKDFTLQPDDTAYDVFLKTQKALFEAFEQVYESLITDSETCIPQSLLIAEGVRARYFRRKDLAQYRNVDVTLPADEILRRVRAFEFPGHERAFISLDDARLYLTTEAKTPRD